MPAITRDFTATTFVVKDRLTLLIYHRKLRMWLPPGGHIGTDELPCDAAVREVREETGLNVELIHPASKLGHVRVLAQPICILLEDIEEGHQHIDLIYFARVTRRPRRVDGGPTPNLRRLRSPRTYGGWAGGRSGRWKKRAMPQESRLSRSWTRSSHHLKMEFRANDRDSGGNGSCL